VVEAAMSLLPYRSKTVPVATGAKYVGKEIDVENICSVSILRSGGVFEAVSQKDAKTLREDH
jgi:uridine kinase